MKKSFVWVFLVIFLLLGCLAGCGNRATPTEPTTEPTYTVTFQDWDGTVINTSTYSYGDTVIVPVTAINLTRSADEKATYTFAGWDKAVTACTGDATYTAVYNADYIDYTVVFENWDGTVISTNTYHYGDTVTVPAAPTRPADNSCTYIFAGWDKTVTTCKGDTTYIACYSAVSNNPHQGKTLQVWALVGPEYESVDKIQADIWLWMVRAAMEEWAHINDVNLQFVANYDQTSLMAAINSGSRPDFVFTGGQFPITANFGLVQEMTDDQIEKIADVIGDSWFLNYRGETYGVQAPWAGTKMVYYNESMMESYGVKTPKEYIEEGNWTWENYLKVAKACTKDLDEDGEIDIWGSTTYSVGGGWADAFTVDPKTGRLINNMESNEVKAWLNVYYDAVKGPEPYIINQYKHATSAGAGIAMSIFDCEPFDFYHTYRTLSNGDIIRTVQMPTQYADDEVVFECTTWQFAIPKNSDEADAAVDMLCYIMQAGMKWMADHSEGLIETEYEGIVGATEYSAAWLEKYNAYLEERHMRYEKIKDEWDVEFNKAMIEMYVNSTKKFGSSYVGVSSPWQGAGDFSCIFTQLPVTSLPKLSATMRAQLDAYNMRYIFESP